jgi:hypothetical protein
MRTSRIVSLAAVVFALVLALPVATFAAGKTHDMTVDIVSIDEKAKTITVKDDKGVLSTAPLLGKAVAEAKGFKVGDKVVVTCQDNEKGGHEGVTALKKA